MNREVISRLDVLQSLLRAPLQVTKANEQIFPAGWLTGSGVVVTHRLLILLDSHIDYTVEGRTRRLEAGTGFFVPAWCRRKWTVPKNGRSCRLLWCEFASGNASVPAVLCHRKIDRGEVTAFARFIALARKVDGRSGALRVEGELKAHLARFWVDAQAGDAERERVQARHAEVVHAMTWLERHFAEADALEAFYRTLKLSPNHFRGLFKRQTGETVQSVLARLRLRRARYLVQETTLSMKQIAAETGHADPLYFSVQYRRFWGRPATEDRRAGGVA